MNASYNFKEIELKWQHWWDKHALFTLNPNDSRPKYYCLMMFPYPSGTLHIGHLRNYVMGDCVVRYKMMQGFNVLSPMGWDALGLPAENAAIKNKIHPREWTLKNIAAMKKQMHGWGVGYDWNREVTSCQPEYIKWTQWIFQQLYKKGFAYQKYAKANWCPACATVLANEQVVGGACERCDTTVVQKDLMQWFFKITDYAEELLNDLDTLTEWPERVKTMQREWIGRSEGAHVRFAVEKTGDSLQVFTTRPDTLFGATYMCVAAEHPLIETLIRNYNKAGEVKAFCERVRNQKDMDRVAEGGVKEGIFTGAYAVNPVNGEKIPIWVANYVLMHYGTGAIMAVPAHDERDFEFAKQYNLPIKRVISDGADRDLHEAYAGDGTLINSGAYNGLSCEGGKKKIVKDLEAKGLGAKAVTYKLRDWLISRQRYWGAPIPVVYGESGGPKLVPEKELPVNLPDDVEFLLKGESPLARHKTFVSAVDPDTGKPARRETDTMDTFVDSSWYFLRYLTPKDNTKAFDTALCDRWLPVDQYIGGVEHAILHLLYARFITKALADMGHIHFREPFKRLFTQGMICKDGHKMSKSKGNVVAAEPIIEQFGVDTLRLQILFLGPPEKDADWNEQATQGIQGCFRFVERVWDLALQNYERLARVSPDNIRKEDVPARALPLFRKTHQVVAKFTRSMDKDFHFNTAIASCMELVNEMKHASELKEPGELRVLKFSLQSLVKMLAPFTPHLCEEIWQRCNWGAGNQSIFRGSWPVYNEDYGIEDEVELAVQVNGKIRERLTVARNTSDAEVLQRVKALEKVREHLAGKTLVKELVVPGKLVNLVVK